jgi:multiple sugar transport system substrate-binding protein
MNVQHPTRRHLLGATAASIGLAAAGGARAETTTLRVYWWGATDREKRTNATDALYVQRNPSIKIVGETVGWGDYWTRLATQAAGHDMADMVQMDYGYIYEYARRHAIMPLDQFVGKELDLSAFSQNSIDGGKVDGKICGVSLGLNSTSIVYDRETFDALGQPPLEWPVTWEDFAKRAIAFTKAAKREGYWASQDSGGQGPSLEVWLRERGMPMYQPDGKFGADASDMAEWFAYWHDLRTQGGCVPPEVQALEKTDIDTSVLTLGKAAITFQNSNQLVGFQVLNKHKLDIAMYPAGAPGTKSGQYLKPSQMMSIASTTKYPEQTAKLLSFFVADPDAGKILGEERGIPASTVVRTAIEPTLDALGKRMLDYISFISDKVTPLPPPPPKAAGEVLAILLRTNETVAFKRATPADAGKQFIRDAADALSRS